MIRGIDIVSDALWSGESVY